MRAELVAMFPFPALMAITTAALPMHPGGGAYPIGFVNHYPMVKKSDERMALVGANMAIMRAPWSLLEPSEGNFDFSIIDDQLELAWHQGIRVVVLIEAGPTHAAGVSWLMEKLRASGETQVDIDGNACKDPSIFSATYRAYLARYARTVALHVVRHKRSRVVFGYGNGCEWWWPMGNSYGDLAAKAFRKDLAERYGTLARLNDHWGSNAPSWESISPPRLYWIGANTSSQSVMVPLTANLDACYCTTAEMHVPVSSGSTYSFRVQWQGSAIRAGGVTAEIAWLGPDAPQPIGISMSPLAHNGSTAIVTTKAPPGATRAWLLAKSKAVGSVRFTEVSFRTPGGRELAPNTALDPTRGGWSFVQWSAGEPDGVSHHWRATGAAVIDYASSMRLDTPASHPLGQVADWCDFRARAMASFIDALAEDIRSVDRGRPVVSYLTFAFANPFEWDYAQQMAIMLERWAPKAANQQVLGMQLASAEGDTSSVTCALDHVRKYGKPMWAVDLLDFTRGTDLGAAGIKRLSQDVVRHGGAGIQYYCWWGTPHYNYLDLGETTLSDILKSTQAYAVGRPAPKPNVALVMPRMPLYGVLESPPNNWADFMGWYKLLLRAGVIPDVYALEELSRPDLLRHRVIVVPDCAYVSLQAAAALRSAARLGLRLITSGRFAERDMSGKPLQRRPTPVFRRFADPVGAQALGETYRHPTPTDTPPRLVCRAGSPAWTSSAARSARAAIRDALAKSSTNPRGTPEAGRRR